MSFLEEVRAETKDVREQVLAHPFVRGLGEGTLDPDAFRFYLAQDYRFLIEYARVIAIASAKSPDLETQSRFAALLNATLSIEMDLHRRTCARFGLSAAELERTPPAPACAAYAGHLVDVAGRGTLGEICAALVPCQHGYAEIAGSLAPLSPAGNRYAEWIAAYASPEYGELAAWICSLTERLAGAASGEERARMRESYRASALHELAFWDMAGRGR